MALFSPTPVLSIVVPHLGNDPSFESSLVSVLENRPRRCEVLVCHDGSYTDPFDLGDEVQFVTAQGNDLPSLVSTAAHAAQGRLLHVLCDGQQATEGWTDSAIDCFEDATVGSLAPSIVDADGKHTQAIGWTQSAGCLCAPVAAASRPRFPFLRPGRFGFFFGLPFEKGPAWRFPRQSTGGYRWKQRGGSPATTNPAAK